MYIRYKILLTLKKYELWPSARVYISDTTLPLIINEIVPIIMYCFFQVVIWMHVRSLYYRGYRIICCIKILGSLRSTTANFDDGVAQANEFFIQNTEKKKFPAPMVISTPYLFCKQRQPGHFHVFRTAWIAETRAVP